MSLDGAACSASNGRAHGAGYSPAYLSYVDFWPKCLNEASKVKHAQFETFDDLVEKANRWLDQHPSTDILSCQTMEKKVGHVSEVGNDSVLFKPEFGVSAVYIKGLRLWYSKTDGDPNASRGYLAYADALPQWLNADDIKGHKYPEYESFTAVLDRVNKDLRENPLEGRILTVETVHIQIAKPHWTEPLDVLKCCWLDGYTRHKYYFLRVFYRMGPSAQETIGIADFVPDQLTDTSTFDPVPDYEGFDGVVEKATQWLQHCEDIRVTNMQTLDTTYLRKSELGGKRLDTLRTINHKIESRPRVMFLRIAYVLAKDKTEPLPPIPIFTQKTIVPQVTIDRSCCGSKEYEFESMKQTMDRVSAWLHEAGAKVICAEACAFPHWFVDQPDNTERTVHNGEWYFFKNKEHRHRLVYFIRLFLDGVYREPDPRRLPMPPEVISPTFTDNYCNIL